MGGSILPAVATGEDGAEKPASSATGEIIPDPNESDSEDEMPINTVGNIPNGTTISTTSVTTTTGARSCVAHARTSLTR